MNFVGIRDSHSDISEADATRLRSDAFWELRRSITVSGESLVKRMRDFEHSRSKSGIYKRARTIDRQRAKKRHSPSVPVTRSVRRSNSSESDEDDVQIYFGELAGLPVSRQKRASSLGSMNLEIQSRSFSEYADQASTCSSFFNDDADDPSRLSFTTTFPPDSLHSTSSSPAYKYSASTMAFNPPLSGPSFSSPAHSVEAPRSSPTHQNSLFIPSHPTATSFASSQEDVSLTSPASRTEKAIAALSLAIANGAAGLSDYNALRDVPSVMIDSQVGELWH